jgi:hypothetical protein
MLHVYSRVNNAVRQSEGMVDSRSLTRAIWINMVMPTKEEESATSPS